MHGKAHGYCGRALNCLSQPGRNIGGFAAQYLFSRAHLCHVKTQRAQRRMRDPFGVDFEKIAQAYACVAAAKAVAA
jgi:hypothetical protein